MGTNFYVRKQHIGKRSAAGPYCWNCDATLYKGGKSRKLEKKHILVPLELYLSQEKNNWFAACPYCKQKFKEESLTSSSAGRELGFNKSEPLAKTGVKSCCRFSWAISPYELTKVVGKSMIVDEYGDKYTLEQFLQILSECPLQYTYLVGKEFA